MGSESPNTLDFPSASFPLTLTLSPRRGNRARSPLIVQHHSPLPRRNSILPLHEPDLGALASRRRVPNFATATRRRDAGAPRFMVPMRVQRRRWRLPMNLGGVRVPSNPDLFWRSSMSGLDGFRLGDYSSERVSPHRSRAQCAHKVRGGLILAQDTVCSSYVVPALAGFHGATG